MIKWQISTVQSPMTGYTITEVESKVKPIGDSTNIYVSVRQYIIPLELLSLRLHTHVMVAESVYGDFFKCFI